MATGNPKQEGGLCNSN